MTKVTKISTKDVISAAYQDALKELEAAKESIRRLTYENESLSSKLKTAQERVQTIATESVKSAQSRLITGSDK